MTSTEVEVEVAVREGLFAGSLKGLRMELGGWGRHDGGASHYGLGHGMRNRMETWYVGCAVLQTGGKAGHVAACPACANWAHEARCCVVWCSTRGLGVVGSIVV